PRAAHPGLVGGRARLPAAARRGAARRGDGHERQDDDRRAPRRDLPGGRALRRRGGQRRHAARLRPRGGLGRVRALLVPARGRPRARLRRGGAAQHRARPPRPARLARGLPRRQAPHLRAGARRRRPPRPDGGAAPLAPCYHGNTVRDRVRRGRPAAGGAAPAGRPQPRERRRRDRGRARRRLERRRDRGRARELPRRRAPARARGGGGRRALRQRLQGDERGRRPPGARRLRRRAGAPDPRRLAQGRGLRPARRGGRPERPLGPPDRRGIRPARGRPSRPRRRDARARGRARRRAGAAGRRGAALAGLRELRPVREFRAARRGVPAAQPKSSPMRRGELESRILILVTLALVAFGVVMVYSATSAAAAVGGADPNHYLERQCAYAVLGILLMGVAQRWDYRRLYALAPTLVLGSIALLLLVLVVGPAVNGARRWISLGPAVFQPSELAKLAFAVWAAAWLARHPAPRSLRELGRPIGALAGVFCVLLLAEPDLGTAIALLLMLTAMLVVTGTPARVLGPALALTAALGSAAIWLEPYRRARFFAFLHPWDDAQGT